MPKARVVTLFTVCALLPYIQAVLFGRSSSLVLNLLALIVLVVTASNLAFGTREKAESSEGNIYPMLAIVAVSLYFLFDQELYNRGDYFQFKLQQPRLEAFAAQVREYYRTHERGWPKASATGEPEQLHPYQDSTTVDIQRRAPHSTEFSYTPLASRIILYSLDELEQDWGYAYSTTGQKPWLRAPEEMVEWRQIESNWYLWRRNHNID